MGTIAYIQANTNGRLHDAVEPSVSALNRGFLYGDAVYEVWRTYGGVLFAVDEHWKRLRDSAAALDIGVPLTREELVGQIRRTATTFRELTSHEGELYVRFQLTRGSGAIGLDPALADQPDWVVLVQALKIASLAAGRAGMHLSVARQLFRNPPGALNPAWKTGNYLNNLLCLREARSRGCDEVVILGQSGAITEAAVCNVWFVAGDVLATPALDSGLLEGVTRGIVLRKVAARAGLVAREIEVRPELLGSFNECFLTSTTRDIAPVEKIDDHLYDVGQTTIASRLKKAFAEYTEEYSALHAEWRV
ncbi:MAG TPA: aminotransferase class IV [Opitutaceae bacterium]